MTMAEFNPVTHVIFDLDGLLLDTEQIYYKAHSSILSRYGKEYTIELRHKVLGTVEQDTGRILVEDLNLPITALDYMSMQTKAISADMPNCHLMPGAERLMKHLKNCGVPMAVATSSSREHVDLKLVKHKELFSHINHLVSGTSDKEVKKGKPAPDVFLVCASKFPDSPPPEKVLVFEDAPNGVVAARSAGMQVVMVPEENVPEEKRSKATLVLSSLENFRPELFGLPSFKD